MTVLVPDVDGEEEDDEDNGRDIDDFIHKVVTLRYPKFVLTILQEDELQEEVLFDTPLDHINPYVYFHQLVHGNDPYLSCSQDT
jgi:hypothetical protein